MAVIKIGDSTFNVYRGDVMLNKLYVHSIGVSSVVLRFDKKLMTFSIGDSKLADVHVPQNRKFEPPRSAADVEANVVASYPAEAVEPIPANPSPTRQERREPQRAPEKAPPTQKPVETPVASPVSKEGNAPPAAPAKTAKGAEMGPI
jgi:hypothetical protein